MLGKDGKIHAFGGFFSVEQLLAVSADVEETFWTRDTITGDWFGARDSLAEHGLTTEFSTT